MGTVVVLGSLSTDLVARAPRLPQPGESLIGDEFGTFLGGKGFNQAIAAARLGAHVVLLGCVGSDAFGDAFFPVLASEGINSKYVTSDSTVGTGIASITVGAKSGQNMIVISPRANLALTAQSVTAAMHAIQSQLVGDPNSPAIFLTQCETSMVSLVTGLQLARAAAMTTILNLAPVPRTPLEDEYLALVDMLIVNETEASQMTGSNAASFESARWAAEQLLSRGPKHVIITLGEQGSLWSTYETPGKAPGKTPQGILSHQEIQSFPVKQVDATAAGDAFCGALAASLAQGSEMGAALKKASAAGAIAATRMGAYPSLPTAAEVEELLVERS